MPESITPLSIARDFETIYEEFTKAIREMGSKNGRKGKSRLAGSVVHWLAGSHVKTERDILCEKFLADVKKQQEMLDYALEGASEEETQEALDVMAGILCAPVREASNSTSDLMKRAMISQAIPYLSRLSRSKQIEIRDSLEKDYKKSKRLPVEKEALKLLADLTK